MSGAVHAAIGACIGSLLKNKGAAFIAGVVSHAIADAVPHKDFKPVIEMPLLAGALAGIAAWRGVDSPEFCGAIGAISPDAEHGLMLAGVIKPEQEVFPTHIDDGKYHGPKTNERWSQFLLAGACLAVVALRAKSSQ